MLSISERNFNKYKSSNKAFPIFIKMNGDELTPIAIYYRLKGKCKFLLESIYSENEIGRYSFIGVEPYMTIKSYGENIVLSSDKKRREIKGKFLEHVQQYLTVYYDSAGLDIPFTGGAIGYVGYDIARQYERLPFTKDDDLELPEACLMFYKSFICYDHFKHEIYIVYNVMNDDNKDYSAILNQINALKNLITSNIETHELQQVQSHKELESNVTKEEFCSLVDKAKEYIKAGDIFQVVLSQRLQFKNSSHPFDVYRRLRAKNPSPYLFYVDFGDMQIAGSSPESLVAVSGRKVTTNPIAGTRVRGKSVAEDLKLKKELLCDEKERAEHVMLVDLGRNDLGKVSEFGTVNVDRFMEVDFYSHVMHIVSKVSGELKEGIGYLDALKACLPVGTVSGAPKIRAMEIIDELEESKRGVYAGAVGYFSFSGNMDTCIGIRTILFKKNYAYVQAGAGIVYDSVPENEYMETLNKAMAMREVI
jgi:anthranilate synthase component 1